LIFLLVSLSSDYHATYRCISSRAVRAVDWPIAKNN
jgi:hypothetical protein